MTAHPWFDADGYVTCRCSHAKSRHYYDTNCMATIDPLTSPSYVCDCKKFKLQKETKR